MITQIQIINKLKNLSEKNYKDFSRKLIVSNYEILGCRMPDIKNLAREISKDETNKTYLLATPKYYEETILQCLLFGYFKMDIDELISYVDNWKSYIDNWATNDAIMNCKTFCKKENLQKSYDYFARLLNSDKPFEIRLGVVLLFSNFKKTDKIEDIIKLYKNIGSDEYYVYMAVSWGLCEFAIQDYEMTKKYLFDNSFSDNVIYKTISKMCDSFRVTEKQKQEIRSFRVQKRNQEKAIKINVKK